MFEVFTDSDGGKYYGFVIPWWAIIGIIAIVLIVAI
jgi:hypothetical protein